MQTQYVQQYLREKNASMSERQIFTQRSRERCPHCNGVHETFLLIVEGTDTHHWEDFLGEAEFGERWVYLGAHYLKLHDDAPDYPGLEVSLRPLRDGYAPPRIFEIVPDDSNFPGRPCSTSYPSRIYSRVCGTSKQGQ